MSSSILIRLGGLVAMGGAIIFGVRDSLLGRPDEPPGLVPLFLLSEMAAIVTLHLLQRGREGYGRTGALASATALVGLALTVGGYIFSRRFGFSGVIFLERLVTTLSIERLGTTMFLVGVLVATIGIVALAMATREEAVLPW